MELVINSGTEQDRYVVILDTQLEPKLDLDTQLCIKLFPFN